MSEHADTIREAPLSSRELLDKKVGHLITAYLVDDGKNVAACERAVEEAIEAALAEARGERDLLLHYKMDCERAIAAMNRAEAETIRVRGERFAAETALVELRKRITFLETELDVESLKHETTRKERDDAIRARIVAENEIAFHGRRAETAEADAEMQLVETMAALAEARRERDEWKQAAAEDKNARLRAALEPFFRHPRWLSIGSHENTAEIRVSREVYEEAAAALASGSEGNTA